MTTSKSSIIDLIATTNTNNIYQAGVIKTRISDHYMVFCIRKFGGAHKKQHVRNEKFDEQIFYDEAASLP